jgi:hypothetical protein
MVFILCGAGCTTPIEPVVPEGELLLTVSDDANEREALGAVRIAQRDDGMQIALTIAELVAPGETDGFRAVVFFEPNQCRAFVDEAEIWPEGMEATYGLDGTQAAREIRRVRMTRAEDGTSDVELSLGAAETAGGLRPGDWAIAATAHAMGKLGVTCSVFGRPDEFGTRALEDDPLFVTEFCRTSISELGLRQLAP